MIVYIIISNNEINEGLYHGYDAGAVQPLYEHQASSHKHSISKRRSFRQAWQKASLRGRNKLEIPACSTFQEKETEKER